MPFFFFNREPHPLGSACNALFMSLHVDVRYEPDRKPRILPPPQMDWDCGFKQPWHCPAPRLWEEFQKEEAMSLLMSNSTQNRWGFWKSKPQNQTWTVKWSSFSCWNWTFPFPDCDDIPSELITNPSGVTMKFAPANCSIGFKWFSAKIMN